MLCKGWRYFFMEITKSNRIIINVIMYSLSIAITSFTRDDGITAQLLHCFWSYPFTIIPYVFGFVKAGWVLRTSGRRKRRPLRYIENMQKTTLKRGVEDAVPYGEYFFLGFFAANYKLLFAPYRRLAAYCASTISQSKLLSLTPLSLSCCFTVL